MEHANKELKIAKKLEKFKRINGLIPSLPYKADEIGFIDWKALIPKRFLVVNEKACKAKGIVVPDSVDNLDDSLIIIRLAGIRWLAKVRGFKSVEYSYQPIQNGMIAKCTISWLPNHENPEGATFSDIASCTSDNSSDELAKKFCEAIAANRSFVRCVRNFLNISIVSDVELQKDEAASSVGVGSTNHEGVTILDDSSIKIEAPNVFYRAAKAAGLDIAKIVSLTKENGFNDFDGKVIESENDIINNISVKTSRKLLKIVKNIKK